MGSGKSTVGAKLAQRLDRPFVDTDKVVEEMLGMPVHEAFNSLGEAAFREAEQDALSDALRPAGKRPSWGKRRASCRQAPLTPRWAVSWCAP